MLKTNKAAFSLDETIYHSYLTEEVSFIKMVLLPHQKITLEQNKQIQSLVKRQIIQIKNTKRLSGKLNKFLKQHNLANEEGIALMCLTETFIRIPDNETAQAMIQSMLSQKASHNYPFKTILSNAATWGFIISGKVLHNAVSQQETVLKQWLTKMGASVALNLINQAINTVVNQFVYAPTIEEAYQKASKETHNQNYSFELLSNSSQTYSDANQAFDNYQAAIPKLRYHFDSALKQQTTPPASSMIPSISIKLSALSPRFEPNQPNALKLLQEKMIALIRTAKNEEVRIIIEAEESHRLEPTLHLFQSLYQNPAFNNWPEIGLTVQAYQPRALPTLKWLADLTASGRKSIPIRLVKGAYWNAEIKSAQKYGLSHYPVFTHNQHTDLAYICCGQFLLSNPLAFTPIFASHNLHSLTSLAIKADELNHKHYILQRFFGFSENIFNQLQQDFPDAQQSIYAPIGNKQSLLPHLFRCLLESSSKTAFIHQLYNTESAIEQLIETPQIIEESDQANHTLHVPCHALDATRKQSMALNLNSQIGVDQYFKQLAPYWNKFHAGNDQDQLIRNPATLKAIGSRQITSAKAIEQIIEDIYSFFEKNWRYSEANARANKLEQVALTLESEKYELLSLLIREGGKTAENAQQEIRQAIDFCRYYASQTRKYFLNTETLPNYFGETNELKLIPCGIFVCISPWNFPLSILVGKISATLAAGNCVIAKPAKSGELVARMIAKIFYKAGFPEKSLQITPCPARIFATVVLNHPKIAGVYFTGSHESARNIYQQLAQRQGPIVKFIAETNGSNFMVVDSTCVIEQAVKDILTSAFDSAGQRSSALRAVLVQNEIAQVLIERLIGSMALLNVGNPQNLATDIGPLISHKAKEKLIKHIADCDARESTNILYQTPLSEECQHGHYFPPTLIETYDFKCLAQEIFGPVLHIMKYDKKNLPEQLEKINRLGFGLTLGIHTRIDQRASEIAEIIDAGNVYINRAMTGSIVGAQPFGGTQKSGTNQKSGGPYTLLNFTYQKTITKNLTPTNHYLNLQ